MRPDKPALQRLRLTPRLAYDDLLHDWRVSGALMLSIVSVLAPLLLLFGLKTGVLETMREILLRDPRNLEVIIFDNTHLSNAWFEKLRAETTLVRFIIPRTRTLNTLIDLKSPNNYLLKHVEIIPTAPGDPLIPAYLELPKQPHEVLLSHAAAVQLNATQGDTINAHLKRTLAGVDQYENVPLTVIGIVPESALSRPALFAHLSFLEAVEDYRDGLAAPALAVGFKPLKGRQDCQLRPDHAAETGGFDTETLYDFLLTPGLIPAQSCSVDDPWGTRPSFLTPRQVRCSNTADAEGTAQPRNSYASARLYAQRPEDVAVLADRLRVSGLEVRTRGEDLARLQAADRLLARVLSLIAAIALLGGYLAFGGAIWIAIERKRTSLALLRLLGLRSSDIVAFCLYQALLLGIGATVAAGLLYNLGAALLNRYGSAMFAELLATGQHISALCHLRFTDALFAGIATLLFTVLSASLGAFHAQSFQPAESLRET